MDGAKEAVYTEKCQAQASTQLSPGQPSALLGLAATTNRGGMNRVAGQRPSTAPRLSLWKAGTRPAHSAPALGDGS
jgi:hypothetical protein